MDHLESSLECLNHLITVFAVDVLNGVVARNYKVSVHKRDRSSFGLCGACVLISPDLKEVSQTTIVMVIKQDCLLPCVSVEPLVLRFEVDVVKVVSCVVALAYTGGTPNPGASSTLTVDSCGGGELVCIDVLLELQVFTNVDDSLGDSFLWTHLQ